MKKVVKKQKMRIAGLCFAIGMSAAVNAQTVTGTNVLKTAGKTNSGTAAPVRVVDNKGTIKYLQVNNGLTQIVNTTNEVTTTTWQLGGTLTENTYIDATGKVFALDGLAVVTSSDAAATTATSLHGTTNPTGYTLLVHDEVTGAVKKLLFSDLVKGGQSFAPITDATVNYTYTDATVPVDVKKISVYRNGVKLVAGEDYTNAGTVGAVTVTIKKSNGADPDDYAFVVGDKIEIQWIQ
ncbi:hypothetical protein Palpr_1969 [Paludibacter propionicigenes WB4]|uniref:Lipocalin-like domain-containing protein n=1 Tax=Paludibacter propionicigenes (strain DSM 17365 / JCM 13257 / WB4) TaxID=694427 RepID=E4T5W2_PALPW|nr:hypothetical protein [Paludibacter propionicigenes]ADQ80106.1 hypothetical protein Palpr_1969 [Paludibacter propionicigenes WB4]